MKQKPGVLKDYFKWHHNPSKGDSITSPEFGNEVTAWWASIQPSWRYKGESGPGNNNDYSYILAGGKKGVYLLILCLAWWDKAHGRALEKEKAKRREAARAAGKDDTDFGDLFDHEHKWFNIVNDLTFVLELAEAWQVPDVGTPGVAKVAIAPAPRGKRAAEGGNTSPRKKAKAS